MRNKRFKNAAIILAAIGLTLAVIGVFLVYLTTFPGVTIERVEFDTAPYDSPPNTVSGLLLIPEEPAATPTPAVVFSHGLSASKEMYLEPCRELAMKGVIVLAIDLRGHGATGGANDAGLTERRDVWAAVDYLSGVPGVDGNRIAVGGHSLGAITATAAGIFQEGDFIKTVVAIAGQPGRKEAAELSAGPVNDFLGKIWPFLGWSRQFYMNNEQDMKDRDLIDHIDEEKPPNYQVIVGDKDSLLPVDTAKRIIEKATGRSTIVPGRTYGSFSDGTARRLVVTEDTHWSEAYGNEVWNSFAEWVFDSFDLELEGRISIKAMRRYRGQALLMLGFFLIGIGAFYLVRYLIKEKRDIRDVCPYRPGGRGTGIQLAVLATVLFAGVSIASFPFARATGIRAFVPFLGADVYTSLVLSRIILLLPVTLAILAFIRIRKWKPLRLRRPGEWNYGTLGKSLLLGVVTYVVFLVLYAPTAHGLFLTRGTPVSIGGYFTVLAVVLVQLYAEQEFFHYFFLPAFSPRDTAGKRWVYILSETAFRGVAFGLAFLVLVPRPLYALGRAGSFPFVLAMMIFGFLLFLPVSALSLYARRRGYSVLAPCLAVALFFTILFSSFLSVSAF